MGSTALTSPRAGWRSGAGPEPGVLSPTSLQARALRGSCAVLWLERPGLEGGEVPQEQEPLGGRSHEHKFWNECDLQSLQGMQLVDEYGVFFLQKEACG